MQSVDGDGVLSWAAAAIIMEIVTVLTVTARLVGIDPFTTVFDIFIVYIPTVVLVNSIIFEWIQHSRKTGGSGMTSSASTNTVA